MRTKWLYGVVLASLTLLFVGLLIALTARPASAVLWSASDRAEGNREGYLYRAVYTPTTVITVTTAADLDTSAGYTCYSDPPGAPAPAPDGRCTLRRALVEADALASGARPTLVAFNIPTGDPGYNVTLGVWKVNLLADLPYIGGGNVIIDGATQPGGRADGPKIIIRGGNLYLGETGSNANYMALNLAVQQGAIRLVGNSCTVENNWVGLSDDGRSVDYALDALGNPDPTRSNYACIGGGSDFNVIRNNAVASANGVSLDISGDDTLVTGNRVGTRADGTLPEVSWNRRCHSNALYHNWFTGDGVHVYGHRNRVLTNTIAGMLFGSMDPSNTPPDALEVTGNDNLIQNNIIGGADGWVCGLAVSLDGERNRFLENRIVNARGGGFGVYGGGYSLDAITMQGNVIENAPFAVTFGPNVPLAWKNFNPAAIMGVAGAVVNGTAGADSACANCTVEVFLDDGDEYVEALQSLGKATAAADGSWSLNIGVTLAPTQGLRTASTTAASGQIAGFSAGTTSKLNPTLYPAGVTLPPPPPTPTFGAPEVIAPPAAPAVLTPPAVYNAVITVTHGGDPDTSLSNTCYRNLGTWRPPGDGLCTLRRAIIEASHLVSTSYPVLIRFDIPTTDPAYSAALGVWKIALKGDLPYVKHGQVTIDGSTQPGGRADGPKIIIRDGAVKLGEIAGENGNIARGLAVQQGSIRAVTDWNIIEDCWAGLSDDGQTIDYALDALGQPDPTRSNYAYISAGGDHNLIRNNVSASAKGVSFEVNGDDNLFIRNCGGTRADCSVPEVPGNRKCKPNAVFYTWFTGDGLHVSGGRNWIGGDNPDDGNIFAGMLFASADPNTSPPEAMEVHGEYNVVQNNRIGLDAADAERGVCGYGIYIDNRFNFILNNTIVGARFPAMAIYGTDLLNAITLQGNVVKDAPAALEFGPLTPAAWTSFVPAQVTGMAGTVVNGTAGDPCPSCAIEVFLDDGDGYVEALESLGVTTATASGDWSLDIGFTLAPTQGLRTASTTRHYGVMEKLESGTTSRFSALWPVGVTPPSTPTLPPPSLPPFESPDWSPPPSAPTTFAHVITVTSASDPDTALSYSCYGGPGITTPKSPCTLRRAIVEASAYRYEPGVNYPILIRFNIPVTDTGYNGALGVWKIVLQGDLPHIRGGQVVVDGAAQPGGRADGPKIIIRGGNLYLGEIAGDDNNVARGLALQQGAIYAVGDWNIIEDNWVGLSDDGQSIDYALDALGLPDPSRSNAAYIRASSNNLVQRNVAGSAQGVNFVIAGNDNLVMENCAGTRADCTVPEIAANRKCRSDAFYNNWFTGVGMNVSGGRNRILTNTIAGMLFASADPDTSRPDAIDVYGEYNLLRANSIGVDADGKEVGVCGAGVYVANRFNQIFDNAVVNARGAALSIYGSDLLNAITWGGNVFKDVPAALAFGPTVPQAWVQFNPAQINLIAGSLVAGTSGAGSPCPYCTVELFLDDGDEHVEALQPVGVTTADANGDWSVDIGFTLPPTRGLRTASTTADYGQIANFEVGTTSKFGALFPLDVTPPPPLPDPTPLPPETLPTETYLPPPTPPVTYAFVLTVTTTADLNTSPSETCISDPPGPAGPPPDRICTLRRAFVDASSLYLTPALHPILIKFAIPMTDTGYIASLGAWKINLLAALPALKGGRITVDGSTQAAGRADGPKIIIFGSDVTLGEIAGDDENVARGLAVQMGGVRAVSNRNIIEQNWVGLSDDGQSVYYDLGDPARSNAAVVSVSGDNNLVQNNVSASARGESFTVSGNDNLLLSNCAGARADCTAPEIAPHRKCHADARFYNWFTGDGLNISGGRNRIFSNTIVGMLFASDSPYGTPPTAVEVYGAYNLFQYNSIGRDAAGNDVGVCGDAFYVGNKFNQFLDNTIANIGGSAFGIYGSEVSLDAITLRRNVIVDAPAAITFGPNVPAAWTLFNAAQVTGMAGTVVNGTVGAGSLCPYCLVELFLDDGDGYVEALESLGVAAADADGAWSLDIGFTLPPTRGLRTTSTTRNFDVIANFEISTTSKFSALWPSNVAPPPADPVPPPPAPEEIPPVTYLPPPTVPVTFAKIITVTSTSDPDTSSSYTCYTGASSDRTPCTLRRALVEAGLLATPRPVLIRFDIPTSDSGYNAALQVWKITITAAAKLPALKKGQVVLDGSTQAGGRADGPRIIIRNSDIVLGEIAGDDGNAVRGIAVQQGGIRLIGDRNVVEDCWVGLSDDGQSVDYANNDPTRANGAVIAVSGDNNLVRNNASASAQGVSFAVTGDDNTVISNTAGTRADGTLPAVSPTCTTGIANGWWTGVGMQVWGNRNQVAGNVIAGMMYASAGGTPPEAMDVAGEYNIIQGNRLGVDANGADAWLCGAGVYLDGEFNRLISNTVANAAWAGVGVYGGYVSLDGLTMRGNVIRDVSTALTFGPEVPAEWRLFQPALATTITGTAVSGIADDDCPYCVVDVYLDDEDGTVEALTYLGAAIAAANGDWSFTLPAPLAAGEGLRTVSTARHFGVIENMEIGTSSKFSALFQPRPPTPPAAVSIFTDTADLQAGKLWTGRDVNFTARVTPAEATLPITYTWTATDLPTRTVRGGAEKSAQFNWSAPGVKTVQVTARNAHGEVSASVVVVIYQATAVSEVALEGPAGGYAGLPHRFAATVAPLSATLPVTFTWSASGLGAPVTHHVSRITDTISFTWAMTGAQRVTVTATNLWGTATAAHEIAIVEAPCFTITEVALTQVTTGGVYTDTIVTFSADIAPDYAARPYSYTLDFGDGAGAPQTGDADPLVFTHTFAAVGRHTAAAAVWNCGMTTPATDSVDVEVLPQGVYVFEPGLGGVLVYTDTRGLTTRIEIPAAALTGRTTFTYTHVAAPAQEAGELAFAGRAFDLTASRPPAAGGGLTATLTYLDADLAAAGVADEGGLLLYYWDGGAWADAAGTCTPASVYSRDTAANWVRVRFCHLTSFGLFGEGRARIYLPVVVRNG